MTPLDRAIIERKSGIIVESLKALEPVEKMSLEQYEADLYMRKATERDSAGTHRERHRY